MHEWTLDAPRIKQFEATLDIFCSDGEGVSSVLPSSFGGRRGVVDGSGIALRCLGLHSAVEMVQKSSEF